MDYNQARRFEGKMIQFKNDQGEWKVGRVVKVTKEGFEIEELKSSSSNDGYGFGFFGPGPFFRRPFFRPPFFVPFAGFAFSPFFF